MVRYNDLLSIFFIKPFNYLNFGKMMRGSSSILQIGDIISILNVDINK